MRTLDSCRVGGCIGLLNQILIVGVAGRPTVLCSYLWAGVLMACIGRVLVGNLRGNYPDLRLSGNQSSSFKLNALGF